MKAIASGLQRLQAVVRFDVSAASAVRWQQLVNQPAALARQPPGGHRRSVRTEVHVGLILEAYEATPDTTLPELQALLAGHRTEVVLDKMWRFFARRGITRKKECARCLNTSP